MSSLKKPYIWLPLWIAIGIAVGIFIGNKFSVFSPSSIFVSGKGNKMDVLFDYISKSYVDTVNINELVEQAIPNIMDGLDPHSTYISAEDMALTGDELEGHFSGIGVEFMIQHDTIAIVNVISGGPSEAVGIMPGDRIVSVNDSVFVGKDISNIKVFKQLRGPKDSKVKLGIKRSNSKELLSITVTRADVPVSSVDAAYKVEDKIGYIKVSKFGGTTYNEFISAIAKLKSQGCESFIIDLQQNGGGYLEAANLMVNEFLNKGDLIVYTEGRSYPRQNFFADGSGTCKSNQVVVLIDESSASASEIFSGAIQDNDRGLILGRRSFGKGLVQNQFMFKDGSAVRLTIARYHTASGRCIQKEYEKGNYKAYSQDLTNRFLNGEFDNPDSIKTENLPLFYTVAKRPVYGNEGIMPDIFIPRDTIGQNSYYIKIVNSGTLREFTFQYADNNRDYIKKNYKTWENAYKYLSNQPLVDNLATYAESKGIRKRPQYIAESEKILKPQLIALIIRNLYGDEGFYPILLQDDIVMKKAVEILREKRAMPNSVKKGLYK